jgi:septal ring factor EnvC (AmiA/AmiB activator)
MMRTGALIAAVLLAFMLCGCSGEQPKEVKSMLASMEKKIAGMEDELAEVKAMIGDLKSELSDCKNELQALVQQKLQEATAAAKTTLAEVPAIPEHPVATPEHPVGEIE